MAATAALLSMTLMSTKAMAIGDAANGKILYKDNCQSCHFVPPDSRAMVAAGNPAVLSSALSGVSQMLFLGFLNMPGTGAAGGTGVNDITAYLASLSSQPPPVLPTAQSINFPLIAAQSIANGSLPVAATVPSGLLVTVTLTTPAICSLSGNTVTFWLPGTCSVSANQAGGVVGATTYAAAPQVVRSFTITAPAPVPLSKRGGIDIEGLGKSAILVRSAVGQTAQMQSGRFAGGQLTFTPMVDPGAGYRLAGVTDFAGNGKSDLAIQDLLLPGAFGEIRTWTDFLPNTDARLRDVKRAWDVQAVGDLDGDGLGDLVWRYLGFDPLRPNDTGVSYIWFSSPGGALPRVKKRGGAPLDWTLLGAADINFDGAADMIYISPANQIRVLMATPQSSCANLLVGDVPAGFNALKFADFTGGRRGDILMRNVATGEVSLLSLNAAGYVLPPPPPQPPPGVPDDPNASCSPSSLVVATNLRALPITDPTWKFYASGDLDGDGIMDVLWLRPDGTLTAWLMNANGGAPTVLSNVGIAPAGFTVFQP